ncbi:hypothetical protein [Halorussus sp. AFM4]|uniref:hypothetical protein n=1 Tax=Halorussus sp. AFM4 TaxID=3421651 RepID=UPI003EBD6EF9
MDDGAVDDRDAFLRMAREFPVRTGIYSFGLPVFGLLQLINGYVHDGALLYVGLFAVAAVALSVVLTRYHVAVYRRKRVTR